MYRMYYTSNTTMKRTNGKFVTENEDLIENVKKELPKQKVQKYLSNMEKIGISHDEAVEWLHKLGENKYD